ncbi:HtrA protease/chaperone protein [hydrothermal vent metagenome]|uniref:Probable periplasmic serine endoprotease DegP-like n=1 Tax=hydrothermal vent metagenome TaxID=652676 RepID=A0A3B0UVL0_9ZZZZ
MMKNKNILLYCVFLFGFAQLSYAQQVLLPDFTTLVEKTGAAVVNITARQNAKELKSLQQPSRPSTPFDRFFGIPQNPRNPQYPQGRDSVSGGSGFIISADGYILTNRHVIYGADEITVKLVDKREYVAELIGEDEASDIAVLKVDAENLPTLKIGDTKKLKIGEWVMAIGSPLSFEHSVTKGIISAMGRSLGRQQYIPYIQTDVPINRGNSGGPLINMDAEVIGINTLILSNTGGYMGLSFSIPIDVAMNVVEQLKDSGSVKRGLLGVIIQPISQKLADVLSLDRPSGALVTSVNKDSAADKAGIQVQDVIVKFNGYDVETSSSLPPLVGSVQPGTKVKINIIRDGQSQIIKAVLGGLDGADAIAAGSVSTSSKLDIGFEVANLSEDAKEQLEVDAGVIVKKISNRDVQRAGLQINDVIIKIGKTSVKNVSQFKKQLNKLEENEPIVLLVKQAGVNRFIVIERS